MKISGAREIVVCLAWFLSFTASAEDTASQPIQFCKQDETASLDFCVAVTPYQNATSASTDLYVTITRTHLETGGWLGVGLGPAMKGALMFVLYDDPQNVLRTSIRTATGHQQPIEISAMELLEGQTLPDIRVVKSAYDGQTPDSSSAPDALGKPRTATANVLIYSAPLWPKTSIDTNSASQPWIWAHNPASSISSSSSPGNETFEMHSHDENIGYGFFWTNFATALSDPPSSPPTFPSPDKSSLSHLTTTVPPPIYRLGGPSVRNWLFHIHGALASLAFLVLYPLGALLLRTSDSRAFNFHWTTQAFASVLLCLGAGLGWILSRRIELAHQGIGLAIVAGVAGQVLLGWRHHISFSKTKGGTWMGKMHVWLGRGLLMTGWMNIMLGVRARGYGMLAMLLVALVAHAEMAFMFRAWGFSMKVPGWGLGKRLVGRLWLGRSGAGRAATAGGDRGGRVGLGLGEEYFELVGEDEEEDEDEDYDEDGRLKADVEWEERRRRGGEGGTAGDGESEGEDGKRAKKLQRLDVV